MKIVLSSNPYRDRGLRAALEARDILTRAGAETSLCLPFQPRKGDRVELPRREKLSLLEEELPSADLLICFGGTAPFSTPPGTPPSTASPSWG